MKRIVQRFSAFFAPKPVLDSMVVWKPSRLLLWAALGYLLMMTLVIMALPFDVRAWLQAPFSGAFVESTLVVGTISNPQYTTDSPDRLRVDDVILAIDGVNVRDGRHFQAMLHAREIGDTVTITVRHADGSQGNAKVVLRRFTAQEQWLYFYLLYIVGLVFAFVGVWVFIFRHYDSVGRAFAVFSVSTGLAVSGILDVWSTYRVMPLWLLAVGMSGAALYNLAMLFPRPARVVRQRPWLLGVVHIVMAALVMMTWAAMYDTATPWRYIHMRQYLYLFVALMAFSFLGRLLYIRMRSEFPIARAQASFILLGFALGFGPLVIWMMLPHLGVQAHFSLALIVPSVLFPFGLAYALLRYRLARTDLLARRALLYASMVVFAAVGYGLLVAGLSVVLGVYVRPHNPYLLGAAAFLIALLFQPIQQRLQAGIDRVFARTQQAYQERLDDFGRALVEAPNVSAVVALARNAVAEVLAPQPLHVFVFDVVSERYRAWAGEDGRPTAEVSFGQQDALTRFLEEVKQAYFVDLDDLPPALLESAAKLAALRAVLYVPLPGRDRLAGFLALGERTTRLYGSQEIDFLENLARQAALAIERAQTVSDLERRVEQLNTLARVAQGVNVTLVFDDLLELLYAQATRLVPAHYFRVLLWDKAARQLRYAFVADGDERVRALEGKNLEEDKPLAWRVFHDRQPVYFENYAEACRRQGGAPNPYMKHALAWMGVPLNAGAETIGVIVLAHTSTEVAYTDEQMGLVHAIADLAAGAIVKARLLEETRQRAAQLAALNRITRQLSSTLDLSTLLEQILASAVQLLTAESGALFLVDEDTGDLTVNVVAGHVDQKMVGKRVPPQRGVVGRAIEARRSVLVADVRAAEDWDASIDALPGFETRTVLVVPMVVQGMAIGALEVINKKDGGVFTADDEQLLLAFAGQAAVAIQNARLYTMTDQALATRVEELSVLQRIDRELNTSLDVRRAMQVTLEWAARRTGSLAGLVGLWQEDSLSIIADQGYIGGELGPYRGAGIPLSRYSGIWRAVKTRQPQRIVAEDKDAHFLHYQARAQIVVPIEREDRVIGLLLLESEQKNPWGEDDLRFLVRLADHAAIAVANAQLYAEVQRANQTKSDFISFVAHELKTPMTSIRGYADLLAKGAVGPVNEHQAQFLDVIRANVARMARLVSDLSDISRIEAGKLELDFRKVDFHEVVDEVVGSFYQQIEAKAQTLDLHVPQELPLVWGDKVRLAQVLTNLVSNAHKYTPENGRIEIWVEHVPNEWQPGGSPEVLHVMVRDNGLGMSEDDQQKIFQKFFRSEDQRAREAPGTGLGLHITKNLVELHGGRIWFESVLGEGTTFHFTVPTAE